MSESSYAPPKVWKWETESGGRFAKINRPVAGATHEKELPVGDHALQLYSLATPNGVKVTVLLEELLALGREGAEYDAYLVNIGEGDQFGSGFVAANPNSKIPALVDHGTSPPTRVFESGAILVYLAEKFDAFLPTEPGARAECLSWLFWQMGSTPFLGGGFGHFYAYAPEKFEYPINRYTMEVKRQLDVLERNLAERRFLVGDEYTIADMATWPWYGGLVLQQPLRRRGVPRGQVVHQRRALGVGDPGAARGAARRAGQQGLGARRAARARAPRGQRSRLTGGPVRREFGPTEFRRSPVSRTRSTRRVPSGRAPASRRAPYREAVDRARDGAARRPCRAPASAARRDRAIVPSARSAPPSSAPAPGSGTTV